VVEMAGLVPLAARRDAALLMATGTLSALTELECHRIEGPVGWNQLIAST
jgi:hypothetical protein